MAARKCFPRRHMPPAVDSIYWFLLNRYRKAGTVWRDDRAFAEDYGVSKNTITRAINRLERDGWIVPQRSGTNRRRRNKRTGMWESIPYDIIEHDTWAATHVGECRYLHAPVPKVGTGQVSKRAVASRENGKLGGRPRKPSQSQKQGQVQSLDLVSTSPYFRDIRSKDCSLPDGGKTKHDTEPCEKSRPDSAVCSPSQNQMDGNERTTRDPADALLTAARVLAKEYGTDGINLAAYICAHAINGTGQAPRTVSYYTISAREGYLPDGDEDFPRTGETDHLIHPEMIEDGLDRLRRAAERTDPDLYDAIGQLEEMLDTLTAREAEVWRKNGPRGDAESANRLSRAARAVLPGCGVNGMPTPGVHHRREQCSFRHINRNILSSAALRATQVSQEQRGCFERPR